MKILIEFIPVGVFFIVYWTTQNIITATVSLMFSTVVAIFLSWLILKKIDKMLWFTLVAALVFGGATIIFNDGIFIKIKPTVINYLFAIVCLASHFVGKKITIFERLLGSKLNLPKQAWLNISYLWITVFVIAGSSNLFVLYYFDESTWVSFRLFGLLSITILGIIAQSIYLVKLSKKHNIFS